MSAAPGTAFLAPFGTLLIAPPFAIVAAGENAASPHHHASDRVIGPERIPEALRVAPVLEPFWEDDVDGAPG